MVTDTLFARQAIYDKEMKLTAYELLFRSNNQNESCVDNNDPAVAKMATSSVITNIFANVGTRRVVGKKNIFINFSRESLIEGIPKLLPRKRVVLEILEGMAVDEELIQTIINLKQNGYKIALDDFVYDSNTRQLIELADIIKIDVLGIGEQDLRCQLADINQFTGQLLAEKIEDYQQFEMVKSLGFDFFQGYFLGKPMPVKGEKILGNRANCIQLLSVLNNQDTQVTDIEKILIRDPKLSYRILMVVNSAAHYLVRKITSLKEAITMLGFSMVKHWVMLIALEKLSDSSQEIIDRTILRAKMCEILALKKNYPAKDAAFVLGLLSTLDILLNEKMENVVERVSLSNEITDALLFHGGELGEILKNVVAYEQGLFEKLNLELFTKSEYLDAYMQSLDYANATLNSIQ